MATPKNESEPLIQDHHGELDAVLRQQIYEGQIIRLPATDTTRQLVDYAWSSLQRELGTDPRTAQFRLDPDELFKAAGKLRHDLYQSQECRTSIGEILRQVGFDVSQQVCDPTRLRVVTVGGHHVEAAAPVYFAHRDTWYSNPQTQITWWMPLHHVNVDETFEFMPHCFDHAVENDSDGFDYDRWTSNGTGLKIGWQDREAGKRELYPQLRESLPDERRVAFSAEPGEVIVFSGQHLHQTIPIKSGSTRFSMDFRTVCLPDHKGGLGPANVDNRSTGDALAGHLPITGKIV